MSVIDYLLGRTSMPLDPEARKKLLTEKAVEAEVAATKAEEHLKDMKEAAELQGKIRAADVRRLRALNEAKVYGGQSSVFSGRAIRYLVWGAGIFIVLVLFISFIRGCAGGG